MDKMANCKACGEKIAKGANKCVHCGKDQRNFFMKHKIITVLFGLIILGSIISSMGGKEQKSAQTNSTTNKPAATETKKEEPKDNSIKAGMYKVGNDIQPGEYLVTSASSGYVEVTKDSTGNLDSIIMNDNIQGRVYVTIENGQYFTTKNAKTYPVDKAPKVTSKDNKFPAGQYKVGVDIQPGEYKVSSSANGYVEVSKSSKHALDNIVSNDNFTGEKYITVASGQYLTLKNAELQLK